MCLQTFDIGAGLVDAFLEDFCTILVVPGVRRLVVAYGNTVFEQIGRMHNEREAVYTVATQS